MIVGGRILGKVYMVISEPTTDEIKVQMDDNDEYPLEGARDYLYQWGNTQTFRSIEIYKMKQFFLIYNR